MNRSNFLHRFSLAGTVAIAGLAPWRLNSRLMQTDGMSIAPAWLAAAVVTPHGVVLTAMGHGERLAIDDTLVVA